MTGDPVASTAARRPEMEPQLKRPLWDEDVEAEAVQFAMLSRGHLPARLPRGLSRDVGPLSTRSWGAQGLSAGSVRLGLRP